MFSFGRIEINTGNSSSVQGQRPAVQLRQRAVPLQQPAQLRVNLDDNADPVLAKLISDSVSVTRDQRKQAREIVRKSDLLDNMPATDKTKALFGLTTESLKETENQVKVIDKVLKILPEFLEKMPHFSRETPPTEADKPLLEFAHAILRSPEIFEQTYKLTGDSPRGAQARSALNSLWEMEPLIDMFQPQQLTQEERNSEGYHKAVRDSQGNDKILKLEGRNDMQGTHEDFKEFISSYGLVKRMRNEPVPSVFVRWAGNYTEGQYKIHDLAFYQYPHDMKEMVSEVIAPR